MHLKDDELVDLAEGTRPESSSPHLASCEQCVAQLREMRTLMSLAAEVEVPEPSPLFWDHLSTRVREAVAADASPQRPWLDGSAWRRVLMPAWAAAVASIIIVVAVGSRLVAPPALPGAPSTAVVRDTEVVDPWNDPAADDDESLTLVSSLSAGLDLEDAGEAGLAERGSAEHAVTQMNDAQLRELQRLLTQELTPSGA
jgi:hypothetical protein